MRFNCTNCNKIYEIDPSLIQGNAVMFTCRKCQQQMVIRKSEATGEMVVATGRPGAKVKSITQEISRVTRNGVAVVTTPHQLKKENAAAWYLTALGRRQGPLTDQGVLELLVSEKITPSTFAWRKSMPEWVRIKDLPDMTGLLEEAIRQNPGIADRLNEKSSLSSVKSRPGKSGTIELKDTEAEARAARPKSLADDLYAGIGPGGIDPRNASIMQHEVSPRDEDYDAGPVDESKTPTLRDMPRGAWAGERDEWDRDTNPQFKSLNAKRRDTAPINLSAINRGRRQNRIIILGVVAAAVVVALIVVGIIVGNSGEKHEQPARPTPRRHVDMVDGSAVAEPARPAAAPNVPAAPVAPAVAPAVPVAPAVQSVPAVAPSVPVAPAVSPAAPAAPNVPAVAPSVRVAPAAPAAGTVTILNSGMLGIDGLKEYVSSQVPGFAECRKKLIRQTDASINFNLSFVLTTSGRTDKVLARPVGLDEPRLAACIEELVKSWEFDPRSSQLDYFGIIGI